LITELSFLNLKFFIMKLNMGTTDRVIRLVIAALIAIIYYLGYVTGAVAYVLLILGGIFLVTSIVRVCPLYTLLGINTVHKSNKVIE
jgi:hypothetical protein